MAGHGRDDQELGLLVGAGKVGPDEAQEIAEGPRPDHVFEDRIGDPVDLDLIEAERRLAVASRHPLEQFSAGGDVFAQHRVGKRIPGIAENEVRRVRGGARGH